MNKKRFVIFLILPLLCVAFLQSNAQEDSTNNYMNRVNYIFAQMDHNRVTTGLLSDFGIHVIPPEYYNGVVRDSNEVDISAWKSLYAGMHSSRFNNYCTLPSQDDVFSTIDLNMPSVGQATPIATMCINYNRLRDDADSAGLVQILNDQIYDVPGADPYEIKTLFAAAPLQTSFSGPIVDFLLKSSIYYTNAGKTISSMAYDPGDGNGFRTINWDLPISVTYSSAGIKTFILRFVFSDGETLETHGKFVVDIPSIRSLKSGTIGYYSVNTAYDQVFNATAYHSGGTVSVAFGNGNSDKRIHKPIIVAKGFDPSSIILSLQNTKINDFLFKNPNSDYGSIDVPLSTGETLESYLYNNGYDIVYVNYKNGTDDIRRNARLFEDVIDSVNTQKVGDVPNTVMGISMGGLVARFALREMEQQGRDHKTQLYISMDSPHNGANVPVGVQALLRHVQSLQFSVGIPGLVMIQAYQPANHFDELKQAIQLVDSPAANQMLIYKVSNDLTYENTAHQSFMNEYHTMGYPQKCYNVAISNGAGNGTLHFPAHSELLNFSASYSLSAFQEVAAMLTSGAFLSTNFPQLAINIIPGKTQLKSEILINAIPTQSDRVYHGRVYIQKKILWAINVNVDITNKNLYSQTDMLPIDGAPGGAYSVDNFMDPDLLPQGLLKQSQFCFVPAVSALALSNWQNYLTSNLNSYDFISNGQTPVQSYYHPMQDANDLHTRFNYPADYIKSVFDNISNTSCNISIQNVTYTTSQTINGCSINAQNVIIQNNSNVIFNAADIEIHGPFEVQVGSSLEVK